MIKITKNNKDCFTHESYLDTKIVKLKVKWAN